MERRWTYAKNRTIHGYYSDYWLTVLLDGNPIGWVKFVSNYNVSCWQWRATVTQDWGNCDSKEEALNAMRDSMTAHLDGRA